MLTAQSEEDNRELTRLGLEQLAVSLRTNASAPLSDVRSHTAERLVGLEWRAVEAEVGWGRWRGRRLYRVADVLAKWVRHPWRVGSLFFGLRSALRRVPLPELPEKPVAESYLEELTPHVSMVKPRPLPYPHIRVAHAGTLAMFRQVASHFDLESVDFDKEMTTGFDMLMIEPGVDDPLDEFNDTMLERFKDAGIPVLFMARTRTHLDHRHLPQTDLVITEDPELAEQATNQGLEVLHIHPSVDETIHNPIGWKQRPTYGLMVVADHPGIGSHLQTLIPLADQVSLHGSAIPGLEPARHSPDRPNGSDLDQHAKNHRAVYATPQLSATPISHIQLVLDLTAAGAPVITPPDPTLSQLLDKHLTATNDTELQAHLEALQHPPTRERLSVPARRHVLTTHTRKHRFEQILTHLDIPTNPTPRISILLATKRPGHIEHAITNVTNQTWPNKELVLILHGQEDFDIPHIQSLTSQLSYPTTIIPCKHTEIFGDILNKGLDQTTGSYITKMDDDDHYGPNHITDLHTALLYSNADITGKTALSTYLEEFDITVSRESKDSEHYHTHVSGATITAQRRLMHEFRFLRRSGSVDTTLLKRVVDDDLSVYMSHPYGFIVTRHNLGHTSQVDGYRRFFVNAAEIDEGLSSTFLGAG
jgi:hypothetical protein